MSLKFRDSYKQLILLSLLVLTISYGIFFSIPLFLNARLTGLRGHMEGEGFHLDYLTAGGPAQEAGLQVGDVIVQWGGRSMERWAHQYKRDIGSYLEKHVSLGEEVKIQYHRGQEYHESTLVINYATKGNGVLSLAVRLAFCLFLAVIALFMVFSKSIDRLGYVTALAISLAMLSILSGTRYTQLFMGPYIGWMDQTRFVMASIVSTCSTLGFLGSCAWFVVILKGRRGKALAGLIFGMPITLIGVFFSFTGGTWSQRVAAVYPLKMFVATSLVLLILVLMVHALLTLDSALEKMRIRWVGLTLIFFSAFHLTLWLIPKWVIGRPLISNIDWLFIPYSLVPISLLLAIHKHHAFGIRGLVRNRIKKLESQLDQFRQQDARKDAQIQWLSRELNQLQAALSFQLQDESPYDQQGDLTKRLSQLEKDHPYIREIRETRLIGHHPCWTEIFETVVLGARMERSVLIIGESGTGKTHIAEALHRLSPRSEGVYREVSCAQFEHGDPAFALGRFFGVGKDHGLAHYPKEGKPGLLQECDGGTLFLDDVDRLPLNVQDLLLYPLEGKPFEAGIGAGGPYTTSVKFIFATNRDLNQMVENGTFRGDILARMGTRISLPPLRERRRDIPAIINFLEKKISEELDYKLDSISPRAVKLLSAHNFTKGNIRQLRQELETAMAKAMLARDKVLRVSYLSPEIQNQPTTPPVGEPVQPHKTDGHSISGLNLSPELAALRKNQFHIREAERELGLSHKSRTLSNHLRGICLHALALSDWNLDAATGLVVGKSYKGDTQKVLNKIKRFLEKVEENVKSGKEASLFNNLPGHYHEPLKAAIARARVIDESKPQLPA